MKKIPLNTKSKKLIADVFTPVGIYLRLRDRFRDTILLESADHHAADNSYSFICINAIAGIEIKAEGLVEFKLPNQNTERQELKGREELKDLLWNFMQHFEVDLTDKTTAFAQ